MQLDAPLFVTWAQCAVAVLTCLSVQLSNPLLPASRRFPSMTAAELLSAMRGTLPLSTSFVLMVTANNLMLQRVGVAFYFVGRSLTTVFNVLLTWALLGTATSWPAVGACALIVMGFFVGADQESLVGGSYSAHYFSISLFL